MPYRHRRWMPIPTSRDARCPEPLASWVVRTDSLTARMRDCFGAQFNVQVIDQGWRRPSLDEARRLRIRRRRYAWIREVALRDGMRPLILARSVIPADSLNGPNRALTRLGSRPLGELLFAGPGTRRSALEIARLGRNDWLLRRLARPQRGVISHGLWARRAVHWLNGCPLLVSEVFLPDLTEAAHD